LHWTGHETLARQKRSSYRTFLEKCFAEWLIGTPVSNWRITLPWRLEKQIVRMVVDGSGLVMSSGDIWY
jgi:hypothetical protein